MTESSDASSDRMRGPLINSQARCTIQTVLLNLSIGSGLAACGGGDGGGVTEPLPPDTVMAMQLSSMRCLLGIPLTEGVPLRPSSLRS